MYFNHQQILETPPEKNLKHKSCMQLAFTVRYLPNAVLSQVNEENGFFCILD